MWQLWLFGVITSPVGLWLWHRQGTHFGLGREAAAHVVDPRVAYGCLMACLLLVTLGLLTRVA